MSNCNICKRPMDDPNVRGSEEWVTGDGDCLRCVVLYTGDADATAALYRRKPSTPKPPEFTAEGLV